MFNHCSNRSLPGFGGTIPAVLPAPDLKAFPFWPVMKQSLPLHAAVKSVFNLMMRINPHRFVVCLITILLLVLGTGCSRNFKDRTEPAPVTEGSVAGGSGSSAPVSETGSSIPAVVSLMRRAADAAASGRHESAAALLERAIRLEPGNPLLWHHLALLKLQQENWQQAERMAGRSNSLGGRDEALLKANWRTILQAREHSGNTAGAAEAAKILEQMDRGE